MLRALKTVTFFYVPQEDRIAGAINAGHPDAWSCWLTRRLALAVLERTADYIATTSNLAQRAPAELRGLSGSGVAGVVKREELQRLLQMLHGVVAQAGWLAAPGAEPAAAAAADPKPARH